MFVCTYVCMYVCMYVFISLYKYIYIYRWHVYVCISNHVLSSKKTSGLYAWMHSCTCILTCVDDDVGVDVVVHVMFRTPKNHREIWNTVISMHSYTDMSATNKCISICTVIAASRFKV